MNVNVLYFLDSCLKTQGTPHCDEATQAMYKALDNSGMAREAGNCEKLWKFFVCKAYSKYFANPAQISTMATVAQYCARGMCANV